MICGIPPERAVSVRCSAGLFLVVQPFEGVRLVWFCGRYYESAAGIRIRSLEIQMKQALCTARVLGTGEPFV